MRIGAAIAAIGLIAVSAAARGGAPVSVNGGDPPQSGPCDPLSPHGHFGREEPVAQAMRDDMLDREFTREIGKEQ